MFLFVPTINYRSVLNPRDGSRAALKKIPSVFQSLLSCIRTFREVKILCELKHENVRILNVNICHGADWHFYSSGVIYMYHGTSPHSAACHHM